MIRISTFSTLLFVSLICMTIGCKKKQDANIIIDTVEGPYSSIKEIITRTYSTKQENNQTIKDTLTSMQSITYDSQGRESGNIYYNLDGSVSWNDRYIYDKYGHRIGSEFYQDGAQTSRYEYDTDEDGKKLGFRALEINTDSLLYDGASQYERNGTLRKDGFINKEGEFVWNFEYLFDEEGNELGYVYIDLGSGDRYPSSYDYLDYDNNGLWKKRAIVENEQIQFIEEREFIQRDSD